jgi:hypothetical protein
MFVIFLKILFSPYLITFSYFFLVFFTNEKFHYRAKCYGVIKCIVENNKKKLLEVCTSFLVLEFFSHMTTCSIFEIERDVLFFGFPNLLSTMEWSLKNP